MSNFFDQFDSPSSSVGLPQGVGQFGPGTKYTPAQMAQLNTARDALLASEARGDPGTYGAEANASNFFDQFDKVTQAAPAATDQQMTRRALAANAPFSFGIYGPDVAMGLRQAMDAGAEGLASLFGQRQAVTPTNQQALDVYKQNYGELPGSSLVRGLAQSAPAAVMLPMRAAGVAGTIAQGAAQGGLSNMLTPSYGVPDANYGQSKFDQLKLGALLGGATGGALGGIGKMFGPTQSAQALMQEGVTPTIGQTAGGLWKTVENMATSIPILGDAIKGAQTSGLNDFNRAIYNRILAPIGQQYTGPVGQPALATISNKLSDAYESTLATMQPSPLTNEFTSGVDQLRSMLASRPDALKAFDNVVNGEVWNRFTPANTLPPTALKDADSAIGAAARDYFNRGTADQVMAARALSQLQSGLRQMGAAANPVQAPVLQAVNDGYAQLVQLQNAAKSVKVARNEGVVTPADYLRGIKSGDNSARDAVFSSGGAMNQDLAQAADKTLSNTYPDSGSVGRGMLAAIASGALAPKLLIGAGIGSLPYLPLLRNAASAGSGLLGNVARAAPYLGLTAPAVSGLLSQ